MKKIFLLLALSTAALGAEPSALKLSSGKSGNFIFEADPKAMITTVDVVIRAGSIHEPKDKEGLNRLTHLALLRGTQQKPRAQFVEELEGLGAAINVDAGASRTMVKLHVINENLEAAVKLLAEALLTPAFDPKEVKALIEEELAKLETERSNNRILLRRAYRQALYGNSPLAFPPEGTPTSVKSVGVDDLKAHWKKVFTKGNILWASASNQGEVRLKEILQASFTKVPDGDAMPTPSITPREIKGRQLYIVNRQGASTTETIVGHPGFSAAHPDRTALEAGMFVFGADFTARLPTVLRKENGWTYGAYASYEMMDIPRRYGGYFSAYTFPQVQFTEKAVPKLIELLEEYVSKGLKPDELKFAKNSLGNSYAFRLATSQDRLSGRVYEALDGAPFLSLADYRAKINGLTIAKIKKAAQGVHNTKNLVLVVVGNAEELKKLAELIPGIANTQIISDPMQAF